MFVQVTLQREGFATTSTDERLGRGVSLDVSPQVALVGEGLGTDWTGEGFLASMRPDVSLKQPRSAEAFAAIGTPATLPVRPDVHAVGGHGYVHLVAVGTLPGRPAVLDATMGLSVSG